MTGRFLTNYTIKRKIMQSKNQRIIARVAAIIAAIILLQTLYFKFTAHPDSVYIFSQLGLEPVGRVGIGVAELIIAILLLIPKTTHLGAVGGLGVISGAIFSHLTQLGIVVNNDGGTLFGLAVITFVCCGVVAWIYRKEIPVVGGFFK